jgi:hypothetical protein
VGHFCNPSTLEVEAGGSGVWEFEANLGYIESSRPTELHSEILSSKKSWRCWCRCWARGWAGCSSDLGISLPQWLTCILTRYCCHRVWLKKKKLNHVCLWWPCVFGGGLTRDSAQPLVLHSWAHRGPRSRHDRKVAEDCTARKSPELMVTVVTEVTSILMLLVYYFELKVSKNLIFTLIDPSWVSHYWVLHLINT